MDKEQYVVWITTRRIKEGSYEDFRRAWRPKGGSRRECCARTSASRRTRTRWSGFHVGLAGVQGALPRLRGRGGASRGDGALRRGRDLRALHQARAEDPDIARAGPDRCAPRSRCTARPLHLRRSEARGFPERETRLAIRRASRGPAPRRRGGSPALRSPSSPGTKNPRRPSFRFGTPRPGQVRLEDARDDRLELGRVRDRLLPGTGRPRSLPRRGSRSPRRRPRAGAGRARRRAARAPRRGRARGRRRRRPGCWRSRSRLRHGRRRRGRPAPRARRARPSRAPSPAQVQVRLDPPDPRCEQLRDRASRSTSSAGGSTGTRSGSGK